MTQLEYLQAFESEQHSMSIHPTDRTEYLSMLSEHLRMLN